jgi:2-polyprenyl-3-methyl-5-hydroxy-6-metoxy-1,4-benzoquinol methylase
MVIPPWAKQAYEDWQAAIEATKRIQETYNDWLAKLDQIRFPAPPENINEQLNNLLSLQIQYFQQITPWMDAKIQEVRSEENHNVTYHVGNLISQINELQMQLASVERQVKLGAATVTPRPAVEGPTPLQGSEKDFRYHAFEQIFRQPSGGLKETLRRYLPYFTGAPEPILDLGCGRGEFLQLMQESGKDSYGVDFNQYEVERLTAAGLKATAGDIQEHLVQLSNESTGGVFCAQVIEHLHPDSVYTILSELHRVMKADAPLVIETVNPLSVFAYHHLFFKDPTHVFPVHPDTLIFMLRYTGFRDVQAHLITPVPAQQKLPEPKKEDFSPAAYQYVKTLTGKLNQLLYDSMEYYVVGVK